MQQVEHPSRDERRINTGALQFDGDWPGIFIRGDEAMTMANNLRAALMPEYAHLAPKIIGEIVALLETCAVKNH